MANYYVDPAAGGAANGSNWDNAWTSLQTALDTVTAGNVVYCRGTQTYSGAAAIDIDTNSGSNANGYVKIIGCNASGNVDGTRFKLNVNGQACNGITFAASMHMIWMENVEIYGTSAGNYDGINMNGGCTGLIFVNCIFRNCGRYGFNGVTSRPTYSMFYRCAVYSNGSHGFYNLGLNNYIVFSSIHDNGGDGLNTCLASVIGCLIYDNTDDGIEGVSHGTLFMNNVVNSNGDDGIVLTASSNNYPSYMIGNRITNHNGAGSIGFDSNSEPSFLAFNLFDNNKDNISNSTLANNIPAADGSTDSNEYYDENAAEAEGTLQGYTSSSDFNLTSTADLRRDAITIPTSA